MGVEFGKIEALSTKLPGVTEENYEKASEGNNAPVRLIK
jgi:hypothetical protein